MSFETDDAAARELILFAENDGDLYRRTTQPILRNLTTKKAQGKYDSEKAVQGFMYLAEAGARAYAKNFDIERNWHVIFPIAVRRAAATHWRDEFEKEFTLGNYDDLIPKKYQKSQKTQGSISSRKTKPHHAYNVGDEVWWWGFSGTSSSRVTGTVMRIHFVGEEPDYEIKIHGAGSVVMKAQHELASETGRKKLAAQTRAADRRKGRRR
jgi:hypothetical protein